MKAPWIVTQLGLNTWRQFRALKRRQWRKFVRGMAEFRIGCAYTPAYDAGLIDELDDLIARISKALSPEEWDGRNYEAERARSVELNQSASDGSTVITRVGKP